MLYAFSALKLRYMIPIVSTNPTKNGRYTPTQMPSTPTLSTSSSQPQLRSPSHSQSQFQTQQQQVFPTLSQPVNPIVFDAPVVARQELGWEEMLEQAVEAWVEAVVNEKRSER